MLNKIISAIGASGEGVLIYYFIIPIFFIFYFRILNVYFIALFSVINFLFSVV